MRGIFNARLLPSSRSLHVEVRNHMLGSASHAFRRKSCPVTDADPAFGGDFGWPLFASGTGTDAKRRDGGYRVQQPKTS